MSLPPSELLQALNWRYATKVFDRSRRIDAQTWAALEQTLVLSPSSYGLQPWKFLVITDPGLRLQLRPHSWDQSQVTDCSHLVVFLRQQTIGAAELDRLIQRTSEVRGVPVEQLAFYREMMQKDLVDGPRSEQIERWASNQVYIALGTFMTASALLGVDTCPIEGFSPTDYDRILDLETSGYRSCVVCAAGYRQPDDKYARLAKVRYRGSSLIERL
ncbi:NAD(P)H-dependent oxidoreductase [Synechococcus sp. CCY9201]|jgi:nitroreductase|nr:MULTISPECIES: NAD(P)H-dependent oxidoreductase [unclassified Synechococcus]CAK6693976.1 Putative NAD(P)H nitroreductase YfkO [Synechococcus sp. CBW1107]MEA5421699.1 NAD(P)H-dependent oxidoreductase [Synechococcus sp. CCY9202]MEA5475955.1 NAD(P)H-dependent oxidoreductase [Synechococcus sp. CCY9201]QPN59589.1 NAD(P)H-dependent oxidoreductase [Synechococcus sp. CBW1002]QPN66409.1 NAD(P)H-dependent oxidoreductase [Synechococcus sp. CBW1006]